MILSVYDKIQAIDNYALAETVKQTQDEYVQK